MTEITLFFYLSAHQPPKRKVVDHAGGAGGVSEIKSFSSRFVSQTKPHPAGIIDSIII